MTLAQCPVPYYQAIELSSNRVFAESSIQTNYQSDNLVFMENIDNTKQCQPDLAFERAGCSLIEAMRICGIQETRDFVETVFKEEEIYQSTKQAKANFLAYVTDNIDNLFAVNPPDSFSDGLRTLLQVAIESNL